MIISRKIIKLKKKKTKISIKFKKNLTWINEEL